MAHDSTHINKAYAKDCKYCNRGIVELNATHDHRSHKEHQLCLDHVMRQFKHKSVYPKNKYKQIHMDPLLTDKHTNAAM